MRDPDGELTLVGGAAIRRIRSGSPSLEFLHSPLASELVAAGRLIPFEFFSDDEIRSPAHPFVSQPHEWCDAQFLAAARFTLDLARELLPSSFELKDASAWNILFLGANPSFCDHLSFQRIRRREWWAFGQFARHFILPLAVSRMTGFKAHQSFLVDRDGMGERTARSLLGWRRFASRYWPLMLEIRPVPGSGESPELRAGRPFHEAVYKYCEWNLPRRAQAAESRWSTYVRDRSHYSDDATRWKRTIVSRWLSTLRPGCVVDLGCNTGEYSRLAAECGARSVISVDKDHDSIQALFQSLREDRIIHPVVANLADLHGGRGWSGEEARGLAERLAGQADVAVCLALLHHLAVSESIPLERIAALLWKMTRGHAIVEFIAHDDPLLKSLAEQRRRDAGEFSLDRQKQAFSAYFDLESSGRISSTREAVLLKRRHLAV